MSAMKLLSNDYSRRIFRKASSVAAGGLALGGFVWPSLAEVGGKSPTMAIADLPNGSAPKPVSFPHFPSRLHAFAWRNWPLVTAERMARVVGAKPADIVRTGRAMGLGDPPRITRDQQARSYITVIKRNWHLLPYDQLLDLLGWTADQLAFTLRFEAPDEKSLQREREIARIVREEFAAGASGTEEPLFGFVAKLSAKPSA